LVAAARLSGAAAKFALTFLVARQLGANGSGVYYLALSLAVISAIVGKLGLDESMLRFVARDAARSSWTAVQRTYKYGALTAFAASSLLAVVLIVSAGTIADHIFNEPAVEPVIRIAGALIPVQALLFVHVQLLKAVNRPIAATGLLVVGPPGGAAIAIWITQADTPSSVMAILVVSYLVSLAVSIGLWTHVADFKGSGGQPPSYRELLTNSLPLLVAASMTLVIQWSDVIMLGVLGDAEDVGIYKPALGVAALIGLIVVSTGAVAAPRFAVLFDRGDLRGLQSLARQTSGIGLATGLPALIVLFVGGSWILSFFGPEFPRAATALRILAVGQFVNVAVGSVRSLLVMTGHQRHLQRTMVTAGAVNILLNLILIPPLGINGAAIATAISVGGVNVANLWWVRATLNIQPLRVLPAARHVGELEAKHGRDRQQQALDESSAASDG
jgi:O-antigen/teichoic acid export membrane protein